MDYLNVTGETKKSSRFSPKNRIETMNEMLQKHITMAIQDPIKILSKRMNLATKLSSIGSIRLAMTMVKYRNQTAML